MLSDLNQTEIAFVISSANGTFIDQAEQAALGAGDSGCNCLHGKASPGRKRRRLGAVASHFGSPGLALSGASACTSRRPEHFVAAFPFAHACFGCARCNHLKFWSQSAGGRLATGPSLISRSHWLARDLRRLQKSVVAWDSSARIWVQRSGTSLQVNFLSAISSHATLGGAPWLARVTQPGFKNSTLPRLSFRGTCVWPCRTKSTSSGKWSGGICWRRNFNPPRARSTTSGQAKLLSQLPRTTVTRGPIPRSSSRMVSVQTSPRCQISSASLALSLTASGKRLWVSARTKICNVSFDFSVFGIAQSYLYTLLRAARSGRMFPCTR